MRLVGTATLESLSTRADGSVKLILGTQELGSDDAGRLFTFRGKYLKWLISDDHISDIEADLLTAQALVKPKGKTPSGRLRAVLFRVHEQGDYPQDFETFYNSEMENIINAYKSKLQPV